MEKEVRIGVILAIISIILLGIVFFINATHALAPLESTTSGDGLGRLCKNPQDCNTFCQDNFGRCSEYCAESPENTLCDTLFGGNN